MNVRKIASISLLILIAISMVGSVNAIVCNTMSNGNVWKDAKIKLEEPAYFTFRVYNSSADGRICDESRYEIDVELVDEDRQIEEVFEVSLDSPSFDMEDSENKQVLLTLVPKEMGFFVIKVTTKLIPKGSAGGTQLIYTTSAKINASVSLEGDESYNEIPFWKIRKDCPNGLVVKQGEECPVLCEDGSKIYQSKGEICPEDRPVGFLGLLSETNAIVWGGLGGALATVAILGLVAYKRKTEAKALDENFNVDQGY